jgi:ABC-type lipoprotein export system ATPase subunit
MVTHDNQLDSYFTHTFTIKEKVIVWLVTLLKFKT